MIIADVFFVYLFEVLSFILLFYFINGHNDDLYINCYIYIVQIIYFYFSENKEYFYLFFFFTRLNKRFELYIKCSIKYYKVVLFNR